MKLDLTVRGMRDYYPEVYSRILSISRVWRKTALSYGFEEFDGPILETLDLYRIKSGDEIVKQLYCFEDKGGRELALRPELTPTLARMVSKIQNEVKKPIKWFSIPRCMRYEKPQKGRLREFYQFNVDVIGEESNLADLDVMAVAIDSLLNLGLTERDFVVKINNRDFVAQYFAEINLDSNKIRSLYKIVDNARKVSVATTDETIKDLGLGNEGEYSLKRFLSLREIDDLNGIQAENSGKNDLLNLFSLLKASRLINFCEFDPTIVRGLDYYTGNVFEIFDRSEKMRAICGGGRYNNLLKEFSGVEIPACGFGMGDVVLGDILSSKGLLPVYKKDIDYFLVRITDNELPIIFKIARSLRKMGKSVEYSYKKLSVKKQMSRASRINARKALIFGIDELKEGKVVEKDLASGEEVRIDIKSLYI